MFDLARARLPEATFEIADVGALPVEDASAAHAVHDDRTSLIVWHCQLR